MSESAPKTVLAVFAHPDDEAFGSGGTLARQAQIGRVTLVSGTRGELGEISDPSLASPENLGEVRERELREAARRLGVTDVRFLGYRDSGMAGTPGNQDPRSLAQADVEEVAGRLVTIMRELRPDAVVTFDEQGGYGHPDHIAINRATLRALDLAADPEAFPAAGPAVEIPRLYYMVFPRGLFRRMIAEARAAGLNLGSMGEIDSDELGVPDEYADIAVDVRPYVAQKRAALAAHRTQFAPDHLMLQISDSMGERWLGHEHFHLERGERGPADGVRPQLTD